MVHQVTSDWATECGFSRQNYPKYSSILGTDIVNSTQIDRRSDARIVRSALDEVKAIQSLLADVYKDAGDGRTILRELVQNADDAESDHLVFAIVESGWPDANNSLLRCPALLVANNGPFSAVDRDAFHQAMGGSKAEDADKIGTFGIGLKSVFHICEAIVYLGAEHGTLRPGALNPWAGTGGQLDDDPLHHDWDSVSDLDMNRLWDVANTLLGKFDSGLILWLPFRTIDHLDRAEGGQYGLGQTCLKHGEVASWFQPPDSLALLLTQCGYLQSIEAYRAPGPDMLRSPVKLAGVSRPDFQSRSWIGRYEDDSMRPDRMFEGRIEDGSIIRIVRGIEALGQKSLSSLRAGPEWPTEPHWRGGRCDWLPRKALAHAAISVVRSDHSPSRDCRVCLRWAVFLPLDDDPNPRPSPIVESLSLIGEFGAWDIILHGYFWPSQDRRSIPGVTDDSASIGDGAVRIRWNRAVRDELLLPLFPPALAAAIEGIPEGFARSLLDAIYSSRTVRNHLFAVTQRYCLLPILTRDGVRWEAKPIIGLQILSIPRWKEAPTDVREQFIRRIEENPTNIVFIDESAPKIGGNVNQWPCEWIASLLTCISSRLFRSPQVLWWIDTLLRHILGNPSSVEDDRAALVANWIASRIGDDALKTTAEGEEREDIHLAWKRMFGALPSAWVMSAPKGSQRAVMELAKDGFFGAGLLPLPLGLSDDIDRNSHLDKQRIDDALLKLGSSLSPNVNFPQSARNSRLSLAETLLRLRGNTPLSDELSQLPLLRAIRLPDGSDEAWSIIDLRQKAERNRVFAKLNWSDEDAAGELITPLDPKQAVKDLSIAIGEKVWIVNGSLCSTISVPQPTPTNLAISVSSCDAIRSDPMGRLGLILRLATSDDVNDETVRRALVSLLTGRIPAPFEEQELFHVRNQDSNKTANQRSLKLLLLLLDKPWCEIEAELVAPLQNSLAYNLNIKSVDFGILHELLRKCLQEAADWSILDNNEALHLVKHLQGSTSEHRESWCQMPFHRLLGGGHGSIDKLAMRAVGGLQPPAGLQSEVLLLDPEPEVADLYQYIPALNNDGILRAMLASDLPQRFFDHVVKALHSDDESLVILPHDAELRRLLREAAWIPLRENGLGVAPNHLLILPTELQECLQPFAQTGALGGYILTIDLNSTVWDVVKKAVNEILNRPKRLEQIRRLTTAIKSDYIADIDCGSYLLLPDNQQLTFSLIEDAFCTGIAASHRGWALLRAVANAVGINGAEQLAIASPEDKNAILEIARSLCSPLPTQHQISVLKTLASTRPGRESPAGRLFHRLVEAFVHTIGFYDQVLPCIELPTQDGQWHYANKIARSASGVARRHRLLSDLREALRLDSDEPLRLATDDDIQVGGMAEPLAQYFEPWRGRVPDGAVGAFICLLGDGHHHDISNLAEQWLGGDVSVEGMRSSLWQRGDQNPIETVKIWIKGGVANGQHVETLNLLGQSVEMEAGTDNETIFAADPVRRHQIPGDFWEIRLRNVEPHYQTSQALLAFLRGSVEWWAGRVLRLDRQRVLPWWFRWGTGSQSQIGPVQASILAQLPLTLRQLDVRECQPLRDALKEAERNQRKREQSPSDDAIRVERLSLDRLATLIRDNSEYQRFIYARVRGLMERYGYRSDSVLLELVQNADDALSQSAEIEGRVLPPAVRRLIVRVDTVEGVPTVDVIHYGRPVNDTGGTAFPAGKEREWDQDLYFMMLLNLSGKPGDEHGQGAANSTTGRFGLGFKSVHLVSENPSVVSGFLAFSILGGLLPIEQPVPNHPDLQAIDDHKPTRVRLPLRTDLDSPVLVDAMFHRFMFARVLLPAFARQICEIRVEGGNYAGVSTFSSESISGAPGWSVTKDSVEIPSYGRWRLLRFRPADAGESAGTEALVIGLKENVPRPFPREMPFLWNVTPTSEDWGCGYALNGSFRLDPGRTHVSLDDIQTLRVVNLLGESLGKGLISLHDALLLGSESNIGLPSGEGVIGFLSEVWSVLATGLETNDPHRLELLKRLHGDGRGVSVWMRNRSVVPTGLPKPFQSQLPALEKTVFEIAVQGLEDRSLCEALEQVQSLAKLAQKHRVVTAKIANLLRPLLETTTKELRPSDLFKELIENWKYYISQDGLHSMRPLYQETVWKTIGSIQQDWRGRLSAKSRANERVSLQNLLISPECILDDSDPDLKDEQLRSAFAPNGLVLAPGYIEVIEDIEMFRRLRVSHKIDSEIIASWYASVDFEKRKAALKYLMFGNLRNEVLSRLVSFANRPQWMKDLNAIRSMLGGLTNDQRLIDQLLIALFPDQFIKVPPPPPPITVNSTFFSRLQEWWDDPNERNRVLTAYEEKAWPEWLWQDGLAQSLRGGSRDHWLGLFILGACRSLGRALPGQHRTFLETARSENWWSVFLDPSQPETWMEMLRDWQDKSVDKLEYSRWISLFPSIYQFSRYREQYRTLLLSAGRRPEEFFRLPTLLAPRVDAALTGAGYHFDAPPAPLNLGLHWVLRELVRLGIIDGTHIYSACWVPSDQVIAFLLPLGLEPFEDGLPNSAKSKAIFAFMSEVLSPANPHLNKTFDIPLRYIAGNADLKRQLGWEA